jgi:hypothetical protein
MTPKFDSVTCFPLYSCVLDMKKYEDLLNGVCLGMRALVRIREGLVCGSYGIEKLQYQLLSKLVDVGMW